MRAGLLLVLTAATLAPTSAGQLGLFDWVVEDSEGGLAMIGADSMHIVGPDTSTGGVGTQTAVMVRARAPADGVVHARIDWVNLDTDGDPGYDAPATVVANGPALASLSVDLELVGFADEATWHVSFDVSEGQWFGFGVWTSDSILGPGVADVSEVVFEPAPFSVTRAGALDLHILRDDEVFVPGDHVTQGPFLGLPDVDGDGVGDLAATVVSDDPAVHIRSGATGATLAVLPFGSELNLVGDLDGGGLADLAISTYSWPASPQIRIYSSETHALLLALSDPGGFELRDDICGLHDLDGDGVPDVAVSTRTFATGRVMALSGADGSVLWTSLPALADDFGEELERLDDIDGTADLAVKQGGELVHGVSGATGEILWTRVGAFYSEHLRAIPDLDGDGHADLFIRSYSDYLVLSGLDGELISEAYGPWLSSHHGRPDAGRDVNGDGLPDAVVARTIAPGGVTMRMVLAISLVDGAEIARVEQVVAGPDRFADHVALVDDLDGDGRADVLVNRRSWSDAEVWPTVSAARVLRGLHRTEGAPVLAASGSLEPGSAWTLQLSGAGRLAAVALIVGASRLDTPFLGGVLVPSPDALLFAQADGYGKAQWHVPAPHMPALPWSQIWLQVWSEHDIAPGGFAASRAVVVTAP